MKKIFFGLAVCLWVMAAANAFADCVASCPEGTTDFNGFCYTESGGEAQITGYAGSESDVEIPSMVNGKAVTSIGDYAFVGCTSLTSVTIPDSVTSIGEEALAECDGLTSVTIGNSVTSIGRQAFRDCPSLTSVTIPDSVTSIGDWAFAECDGLTSIDVDPDNGQYSSAGGVLYNNNKSVLIQYPAGKTDTAFAIPNSVTSIGEGALAFCSNLTSIDVDPDNGQYSSAGGVLYNNNKSVLIQYPAGKTDTAFAIPDSVTSIGVVAFAECDGLISVTIPGSVTSIGDDAFAGCTSLTSVTIPDSVTSIGDATFADCTSLTSVTIGNSVTSIGEDAFEGCTSLTSVTIGNSVTSIGEGAFYFCVSLTSVTIPASVTSIEDAAFWGCTSLTVARFLGDAPFVGEEVFYSTVSGFKVCHTAGAAGFDVEPWLSYNAQVCEPPCEGDEKWDLDGDCDVDKEDSKLLSLRQKAEKTDLANLHKTEKAEMKAAIGSSGDCGMGWDLDGDCAVDKDDAKLLSLRQKDEKTDLANLHKTEKAEMKAAL